MKRIGVTRQALPCSNCRSAGRVRQAAVCHFCPLLDANRSTGKRRDVPANTTRSRPILSLLGSNGPLRRSPIKKRAYEMPLPSPPSPLCTGRVLDRLSRNLQLLQSVICSHEEPQTKGHSRPHATGTSPSPSSKERRDSEGTLGTGSSPVFKWDLALVHER